MSTLVSQLTDLRARLGHLESRLMSPLTFAECNKEELELMLRNHEELQSRIDDEAPRVDEVLDLCEQDLIDGEAHDVRLDLEYIQNARDNVIRKWKNISTLSTIKKRKIQLAWTLLMKLCDQEEWVNVELQTHQESLSELSTESILNNIACVEEVLNDIESNPGLKILEQSYSKVTGFSYSEMPAAVEDAPSELTLDDSIFHLPPKRACSISMCLNYLPKKAVESVQSLRFMLDLLLEFTIAHQRVIVALTQTDTQLTNLEHLCNNEEMLGGVLRLEKEVQAYSPLLQSMDNQGQGLLERTRQGEGAAIQSMMNEYWTMWKETERRLYELKASIPHDVEGKLLDQTAQSGQTCLQSPVPEQQHTNGDDEDEDQTVLSGSYRFLGRVLRASLPIQAALMLLVAVASLVPSAEEDYSCTMANNFARSFETMLTYSDGPPPV